MIGTLLLYTVQAALVVLVTSLGILLLAALIAAWVYTVAFTLACWHVLKCWCKRLPGRWRSGIRPGITPQGW